MRKTMFTKQLSVIALFSFLLGPANADIQLNGFATIAGGITSSDDTLYGYTDKTDFKQDSLFALQASADIGGDFGVTTQIISRGSDDWEVTFEWAYISYEPSNDWRILLGRQRAPQKLYSDFVDVGYAYPWITPPRGLYSPSFDSYDGIGSIYNFSMGDFDSTFHAMYGRTTDNPFGDAVDEIDISDFIIGTYTVTNGFVTARVAAASRNVKVVIPGINDGIVAGWRALAQHPVLSQTGVDFVGIGDAIEMDDKASFYTAALKADFDNGFAVVEWETSDFGDSFLGETSNWFVSGGFNISDWVIFATYGVNEREIDSLSAPDKAAGLGLDALIIGSKMAMGPQLVDDKYYSIGGRWNFHDSAAFKIEVTKYDDNQVNPFVQGDLEEDASLLRVALVTVF